VRRLLVLTSVVVLLAACRGSDPAQKEEAPSVPTFTNPVFADNFPEPGAILVDGAWYAYGTNGASANVPVMTSRADRQVGTPAGE
jgi:predicted ribosome quality control (RQC) complex YloA/Tae2 family protein